MTAIVQPRPPADQGRGRDWVRSTQRPRYYNGSYSYYQCNDCTNYMSQALFYGGIPETSTWKPYTSAWINVNAFYNYMSSKGYLSQTSVSSVPAGGLVTFGPIGSMTHTEMVVYNDGSTQEYSGHTTDRDQYSYSYSFTGAMWWVVNY